MPEIPARPFSRDFAHALRGYMRERSVLQREVAAHMDKSAGFVSEHLSGQRAVDTDMLDVIAELAGTDTRHVLLEVARRIEAGEQAPKSDVAEATQRIAREARAIAAEQSGQSGDEGKADTPGRTGTP